MGAALAGALLTGCTAGHSAEAAWLTPADPGGAPSHRFVARGGGWRVTPWPARFPLNAEASPPLDVMTGAATVRPLGCGVDARSGSYFDEPHGPLVCAQGAPDGSIHVGPVGEAAYVEVFDALDHSDGRIVVARRHGANEAEALVETPGGRLGVRLAGAAQPRAAMALDRRRVAVLHGGRGGLAACQWSVFEIQEGHVRVASTSVGPACDAAQFRLLRDQASGKPYLLASTNLRDHAVYFLDDLGGSTTAEARAPLSFDGPASAPVIHDGVLYYSAALDNERRPLVATLNLGSREHRRYAFPGPSSPTASAPDVFAFVIPQRPGESLGVLISDERGILQLRSFADAAPVA